jgi:hypothetical protein
MEYPEICIVLVNMVPAQVYFHQQDSLVKNKNPTSWWHRKNWQTYYHIENWKAITERLSFGEVLCGICLTLVLRTHRGGSSWKLMTKGGYI